MRTLTATLAAVALTLGLAAPAAAHPEIELQPALGVDLTSTSTDNVGFVARFHEHFGTAGGVLTSNDYGEFFVVTDPRGVFTYDVSNPEAPALLGFTLVNQGSSGTGAALAQEDPSTDGSIVLVDGVTPDGTQGMQVVDISDPTSPTVLGSLGTTDHTWTCVTDPETGNGCAYAYGRSDNIIDLTDPTNPVRVEEGWKTQVGTTSTYTHDLTEIRPGLVMSAGSQPVLLDTTDPANPIELVRVDPDDHDAGTFPTGRTFPSLGYHSVEWGRQAADDFLIMGTEIAPNNGPGGQNLVGSSDCRGENSVIESWDARDVRAALAEYEALVADGTPRPAAAARVFGADRDAVNFHPVDAFDAGGQGIFLDGKSSAHQLYCAHWMEKNPSWFDGGMLAVAYYDRGTRFVQVHPFGTVDKETGEDIGGTMEEFGWFSGAETYAGSAQWITDDVVYIMDYRRGMDVVKLTDTPATDTYSAIGSVSDGAMTIAEMEGLGIAPTPADDGVPHGLLVAAGLALAVGATLRRRQHTHGDT